eukprot:7129909-Alexandrium_andersonii.AAC.1
MRAQRRARAKLAQAAARRLFLQPPPLPPPMEDAAPARARRVTGPAGHRGGGALGVVFGLLVHLMGSACGPQAPFVPIGTLCRSAAPRHLDL